MNSPPLLLAVETSCDETAAALIEGTARLRAAAVETQAPIHAAFGGVVPEVASRNHLHRIRQVVRRVLDEADCRLDGVDAFAATGGPGLASALLVGMSLAKSLALGLRRPFLAVNHIEGHLLSPFFGRADIPPSLGLVVSGGHTLLVGIDGAGRYRLLGRTLDDAAGEAFDKVAKLLGLGYPGGPEIDRLAREGDPDRFDLPRGMAGSGDLDFSFSGIKTAVRYLLPRLRPADAADVCASFQEAVVDVLVRKTLRALRESGRRTLAVSGGVSLNSRLRRRLAEAAVHEGFDALFAAPALCTDNAAMIAFAAAHHLAAGRVDDPGRDIQPQLGPELFSVA